MKIVVFGGGGFIGSAIVDRLLRDKHSIRVFERPRVDPYRQFEADEAVEWVTGDLMSTHDVGQAIAGMDVVFHLVSTTLPKGSNDDPIYDVETNLIGSLQILQAMVEKKVGKIVFISSGGTVYGDPRFLPITESHPTDPHVSYGVTKLAIEKYLLLYKHLHGLKVQIMRVTNPYGQRQRIETAQGAVGVFLHRALNGQPVDIWGDGTVVRDYIHVSDVAEAFARAVSYEGNVSVMNISSGVGVSLNELVKAIEGVTARPLECNYQEGRPFDVPVSVLDNQLAKHELGWAPVVSLDAGLRDTVNWISRPKR